MKRCLNIPTTDEVLWKNIIDVLGNSVELKEWMSSKTSIGKSLKSKEMEDIIQNKESKITELTRVKNDLEKGLVKVETEQILNHYPSIEVYKSLKKELTKKYNSTKIEIEELRNSLEQIGNDELWFGWIERFSEEVKDRQDLSDDLKKDFLKLVVKDIVVEYDHTDKVHVLTINFKIPVILRDGNEGLTQSTRVIVTPPKSGRKPSNQSVHVGVYSTVVNYSSTTPEDSNSKGLNTKNFYLSMEDQDLCRRVLKHNRQVVYFPSAELIHLGGQTVSRLKGAFNKIYLESKLYFFKKYT